MKRDMGLRDKELEASTGEHGLGIYRGTKSRIKLMLWMHVTNRAEYFTAEVSEVG